MGWRSASVDGWKRLEAAAKNSSEVKKALKKNEAAQFWRLGGAHKGSHQLRYTKPGCNTKK